MKFNGVETTETVEGISSVETSFVEGTEKVKVQKEGADVAPEEKAQLLSRLAKSAAFQKWVLENEDFFFQTDGGTLLLSVS